MKLRDFLKQMPPDRRLSFAADVGTTLNHLNNVSYGTRVASAALTRQIAMKSDGVVREWDLRPDDWALIWPELATPAAGADSQAAAA
jgi:DNA-binding transcriptional regulator YdaS (Cro superfamily)